MSKRRRYLVNQLKTGVVGGAIKNPPHRIAGRYAKHPAITLYGRISKEAVNKLLADGVSIEEIGVMKNNEHEDQSMFKP
jgi:hypothetical protein